jgi:septum formation protein
MRKRLVLASTSPYRRALLERLCLPFEVAAPGVDEQARDGEAPDALAVRLALAKARSVMAADTVVIGSDQVAALDGVPLRKPLTHDVALRQLMACQGRNVQFFTAVAVIDGVGTAELAGLDETVVSFRQLPPEQLDRYLATERPYDCAGGFKAEGLGIVLFEQIRSQDPTALLGLPLIWLTEALRSLGLSPLATDPSR